MNFQTTLDPQVAEVGFRVVQNSYTATLTITAGSIAVGSPVILETATNSLPSTTALDPASGIGNNWVRRPATSTSIVNNLMVGLLAKVPSTQAYLDREQVGLAQAYGPYIGAQVQVFTTTQLAGQVMIPESLQFLFGVTGPTTAASTGTAANVEVPALGGLAILMADVASSSATSTGTGIVFLRCM